MANRVDPFGSENEAGDDEYRMLAIRRQRQEISRGEPMGKRQEWEGGHPAGTRTRQSLLLPWSEEK